MRITEAPTPATGSSAGSRDVHIRRVRRSDQRGLERFYDELSPASRRQRFLGYQPGLSGPLARTFCTPDHTHTEGFVAVLNGSGGDPRIVGHLCLAPAGERRLELALAVADEHQGYGIGRGLLEQAIEWACRHRVEALVASAFADNARVVRLLSSAPYPALVKPAHGGVVDVTIPLVPGVAASGLFVMPRETRRPRRLRVPG